MRNLKIHLLAFFVFAAATVAFLNGSNSRGQSRQPDNREANPSVKPVLKPIEGAPELRPAMPPPVPLTAAVERNDMLRSTLIWTFGEKKQLGWYLYTPLINQLLKTGLDSTSENFATSLSDWQRRAGLNPTGVLEEDTLYAMIADWQGNRIKDRTPATPDQLMTAPVADFFDPTRPEELRQVEKATYAAYQRMIKAAVADRSLGLVHDREGKLDSSEKFLKIISAFRTREYQDKLRQQSPNAGRAGLAINSPHFTGRALDLYVGGDPVDTTDSNRAIQVQTKVYQWLVRNAGTFGFQPYFYEPWHWEYVADLSTR